LERERGMREATWFIRADCSEEVSVGVVVVDVAVVGVIVRDGGAGWGVERGGGGLLYML